MKLSIYTDGSCTGKNERGADNIGGWGCVFVDENNTIVQMLHGITKNTTNNREELTAIMQALDYAEHLNKITDGGVQITIISDSAYAVNMLKDKGWIWTWAKNNWKRGKNQPIENLDIIQKIYNSLLYFNYNKNFLTCKVTFVHTRGHVGDIFNEIADGLATGNNKKIEKLIGRNPEIMGVHINEII